MKLNKVGSSHQVKISKIRVSHFYRQNARKDIARILTVINQANKEKAREENKSSKFKHLDLRVKKTRSIRRRLTKDQRNKRTEKQRKVLENFPARRFALSA